MRSKTTTISSKPIAQCFMQILSLNALKRYKEMRCIKCLCVAAITLFSSAAWSQAVSVNFMLSAPTISNITAIEAEATPNQIIAIPFLSLDIPYVHIIEPEFGSSIQVSFTVGDQETPLNLLIVEAVQVSSTFPTDPIFVITGSGANRVLTITAARHETGRASITLSVRDGNGFVVTSGLQITFGLEQLWVSSSSVSSSSVSSTPASSSPSSISSSVASFSSTASSVGSNISVTLEYQYDALGRLVIVNEDDSLKTKYCYDPAGNRHNVVEVGGNCTSLSTSPELHDD